MIGRVLILGLFLVGADGPRNPARPGNAEGAVDRITLRDGSVVLGVVTAATSGPRGAVEFLVRREWAEKHLKDQLARWDRSSSAAVQRRGAPEAAAVVGLASRAGGGSGRRA